MGYTFTAKKDIRAALFAGIVYTVRCACAQGGDAQYVAGILAFAEYRALGEGFDWVGILANARQALGENARGLIDVALTLDAGETYDV